MIQVPDRPTNGDPRVVIDLRAFQRVMELLVLYNHALADTVDGLRADVRAGETEKVEQTATVGLPHLSDTYGLLLETVPVLLGLQEYFGTVHVPITQAREAGQMGAPVVYRPRDEDGPTDKDLN